MKVVVAASRKGGGGKTQTIRHLAVECAMQGHGPACIVDADPMHGLLKWWVRRQSDEPRLLHAMSSDTDLTLANVGKLAGALPLPLDKLPVAVAAAAREGYKVCFIDTAPSSGEDVQACIALADLVLMPVRPTQDDLDAVAETLKLVKDAGKPAAFLLNAATKGAVSTRAAANALVHRAELAVPTIHRSEAVPATRGEGLTIGEVSPNSPAAAEYRDLWRYVAWRLGLIEDAPGELADIETVETKPSRRKKGAA